MVVQTSLSQGPKTPEQLHSEGRHRDALRQCVTLYGEALGRFCMALTGSQDDSEEILQEVFTTALKSIANFRAEGSMRSWLFGIARNLSVRHLATQKRAKALTLLHDERRDATVEATMARAKAHQIRSALGKLRPSDREALLLRFQSDLGYREIGALLEVDEAAARKRVSRAIVRLRDVFLADGSMIGDAL